VLGIRPAVCIASVCLHTAGRMHRISLRMHTAGRMHSIGLFEFDKLTVAVEEGIQVSCSRNVAELTLGNILSVTELYINGIVYHKIVLIALR